MQLFKKKQHQKSRSQRYRDIRENILKSAMILGTPLLFAVPVSLFWYLVFYRHDWHFNDRVEGIATAAWIPMFGILYSLLAAVVLSTVWGEYKEMRIAVKRYDYERFLELRDEEMSPLMHVLVSVLSMFVLTAFIGLKYPDAFSGVCCIGTTAYLFALLLLVVLEIDDPCGGIWFIKNIPSEWLLVNVKDWRKQHCKKQKEEFSKYKLSFVSVAVEQKGPSRDPQSEAKKQDLPDRAVV